MMKEVSCRPFDMFLKRANRLGVPRERLVEGTGYGVPHWSNKNERVEWTSMVRFLENAAKLWSDEELVAAGADTFKSIRPLGAVARILFDARGFYEWVFQKQTGAGDQMFSCIDSKISTDPDGRLRLQMAITGGQPFSREFFLVCKGNYTFMPRILGLPESQVEMHLEPPLGATFLVKLPEGGGHLRKVWRAIRSPFDSRAVALELHDAHNLLTQRYDELALARHQLEVHARELEMVNALGRDLTQRTDMKSLADAVSELFRKELGANAIRISLNEHGGSGRIVFGDEGGDESELITLQLAVPGQVLGQLSVWGGPTMKMRLVDALRPWLSIAFANARHLAEVEHARAELEARVEARTADLKRASAELEESLNKQRELDRAKTEFFANAQHELRTPLTLLLAPVESLSADSRVPDHVREELRGSLRSGYRLLKLVNDLLDLSKVEAGELRLQSAAVDLTQLLTEAVRPFQTQLRGRRVALELQLPPKLELVADPERVEQIVLNLLSNAGRFTPDGGKVVLRAAVENDRAVVSVENTGEQIAPEELSRLFQRFAQGTNATTRRYGTTGLGLAVVKEFVDLHGGTIRAENVKGGVRFLFDLPMTVSPDHFPLVSASRPTQRELNQYELSAGVSDPAPPHSTEVTHDKPLLLVVEDNPDLRGFLVRNLRPDYEIIEAVDGLQGLKLAKERLPHIILSDLMMPELSGTELCAKVKADPNLQGTPFILLTARSDMSSRLGGLEQGADDYLVKPFSLDEVKARLRTHLRVRNLSQRAAHREKLAALGTMIAGVAHEMRNPLNGVINSLRPMRELMKNPDPEVAELLDIAIDSCVRVEKISTQLLRQAHPGEWTRSEVNLAENVRTATALMAFKAQSGPSLVVDLEGANGARVVGEAGALNQVWVNLIDNAIQAAGPRGQVTVSLERSGDTVSVEVRDNGAGIPPSALPRIFDPFFTTKQVGSGTGLGLSFVRETVEAHGGAVSVQSSPGEGARFRVTLPAVNQAGGEIRAS